MKRVSHAGGIGRSLDVRACLGMPEFQEAEALAGTDRLDAPIAWVSVIEWPVEHFVSPQDLVLTTGVGCDEERLCEMVRQVADAGAPAVCIGTGSGAIHETVGKEVVAQAERSGVALIALPWRVRFSDLSRAVIRSLNESGPPEPDDTDALPVEFTRALLGPSGIAGVAEALEHVVGAPVVILDGILTIAGSGRQGTKWLARPGTESALIDAMVSRARDRDRPATAEPQTINPSSVPETELVVTPALVQNAVLGWVAAIPSASVDRKVLSRAIVHAGTAAAIELLRKVADDEAATREKERFIWEVARGSVSSPRELTARSALFDLSPAARFTVGISIFEPVQSQHDGSTSVRTVVNQLRRRLSHPSSVVAVREREVLICIHEDDTVDFPNLVEIVDDAYPLSASLGLAAGFHQLAGFPRAVEQARTSSGIARALWGPGHLGNASELGAYLMLHPLVDSPETVTLANEILNPLERSDQTKRSQLISTLEVYLQTNGNVSSAARLLHLNRHSLMYRLQRISELTRMDLNSYEDRILLGMSLKMRRLQQSQSGT